REVEGFELVGVADALGDPHNVAGSVPRFESVEQLLNTASMQPLSLCLLNSMKKLVCSLLRLAFTLLLKNPSLIRSPREKDWSKHLKQQAWLEQSDISSDSIQRFSVCVNDWTMATSVRSSRYTHAARGPFPHESPT